VADPSLPVTEAGTTDPTGPVPAIASPPDSDAGWAAASGGWQETMWRRLRTRPRRGVVAGLVVGAMFGLLSGELMAQGPTTWTSRTVLFFDDPLGIAVAGDPGELAKLTAIRYEYANLAATEAMAGPVATELKVPVSTVLASTSVVVPVNSLLVDVDGTSGSPAFATRLSTTMAQEIIHYIHSENTTFNIPPPDQTLVSVVSAASTPVPSGPSGTRAASIGVIVFLGAFLVVFVAYQLLVDPRRPARR
jgi:hypothetical protein